MPNTSPNTSLYRTALVVGLSSLALLACQKDDGKAGPAAANAATGAPGGRSGRGAPSITLAKTDIAVVGRDTIEDATPISGDLRPIETVEVRSRIEGDLLGVYVREGQQVNEGQLLARFESSEQESGQKSAEADRVAAESELANAEWNAQQSALLLKAGAISQQNHRIAEQAVSAAKAKLAATESRLKATSSTVRDTRVLSPTAGVVSARNAENGEHIARGGSMFSIVRNDPLELAASVPARLVNAVRPGQTVHFVADARNFSGRIARISPTIDPATRSGTIFVEIPNRGGALKSGTFATGRIVNRTIPGAVVVPLQAVRQGQAGQAPFVYRIEGKSIGIAQVTLGVTDDRKNLVEVLQGLDAGDRVVVGNVGTIGRGMQVTIVGEEGRSGSESGTGTKRGNGRRGG